MKHFQQLQYQLTEHIRQPERNAPPEGIEDRRLSIYRELFFNNVLGFVNSAFPVLHSLYSEQRWLALVRQFFAEHDCHSPLFLDISKEFVAFLAEEYSLQSDDPVFIRELAHYEWVELAVAVAQEKTAQPWFSVAPNRDDPLSVAATAKVVSYAYPVHTISVDNQPKTTSQIPTSIVVYRDQEEQVCFMEINLLTAQLLALLQQEPGQSVNQLVSTLASLAPQFDKTVLANGAMEIVTMLAVRGVIRIH
jgi:hypothetical protein